MTSTTGSAKKRLLAVGIVVIVIGVLAAAGLWYSAGQRYDDAVRGLARAPIGCDTTLDFADSGTYLLFVETTGSIGSVAGDCDSATEYDSDPDEVPPVRITLWDPNALDLDPDQALDLDRGSLTTYDAAGFVGRSIRSVEIATPGDHVLRVESTESGFAIAVGRDPNDGVGALKIAAVLAALVGVLAGTLLIVLAARRRDETDESDGPAEWPAEGSDAWVTTPPVAAPPVAAPPGAVPSPPPPATWQPAESPPVSVPEAFAPPPAIPQRASQPVDGAESGRSPWAPPSPD